MRLWAVRAVFWAKCCNGLRFGSCEFGPDSHVPDLTTFISSLPNRLVPYLLFGLAYLLPTFFLFIVC